MAAGGRRTILQAAARGAAGEMKMVPSVEYTVIKTVDIESEPGVARGWGLLQDSPGARSRTFWLLPES